MPRSAPRPATDTPRQPTSVSLPQSSRREARAIAVDAERRRRWLEQNGDAIAAWNDHVAKHGLPLDAYWQSPSLKPTAERDGWTTAESL